jgi:hypothetical protein
VKENKAMYEVLFEIENVTKDMPIEEIETKIEQETGYENWFDNSYGTMFRNEDLGFAVFEDNKLKILGDI